MPSHKELVDGARNQMRKYKQINRELQAELKAAAAAAADEQSRWVTERARVCRNENALKRRLLQSESEKALLMRAIRASLVMLEDVEGAEDVVGEFYGALNQVSEPIVDEAETPADIDDVLDNGGAP